MKIIYIIFTLLSLKLYASDSKNNFVIDMHFSPKEFGIVAYNSISDKNVYFLVSKIDLKVNEVELPTCLQKFDLKNMHLVKIDTKPKLPSHKYQSNVGDVSYELTKCSGYSKKEEMWNGICLGMNLSIGNKKYFVKDYLEPYSHYFETIGQISTLFPKLIRNRGQPF